MRALHPHLIPPPRFYTLHFHGVLGPRAAWRSAVIPRGHCRLNDVIKSESLSPQNGCDVVQHSPGLRGDVAGDDLTRLGIERNLAAAKEEPSAAHRLRVGADCRRRFIRGNDLLHAADCNCKSNRHNQCCVVH